MIQIQENNRIPYLPILCAILPNKLVPIKYEMLAGKNAAPNCQFSECIVFIIQMGKDGSIIAIPILANVIAPAATKMYGSLIKFLSEGPSCSSLLIPGCKINSCRTEIKYGKLNSIFIAFNILSFQIYFHR
jgi:hypothetical protein